MALSENICLLFLMLMSLTSKNSVFSKNFKIGELTQGEVLAGYLITRLTDKSFIECIEECRQRLRCQSINYDWTFHFCELNYKDHDESEELVVKENSVFTSIAAWIEENDQICGFPTDELKTDEIFQQSIWFCSENELYMIISDCDQPPQVSNAHLETTDGIGIYSKGTYTCQESCVSNLGDPKIVCKEDGMWSKTTFNCTRLCGPGQEPVDEQCKDCDYGTYSTTFSQNACEKCPVGTYQNQKGRQSCLECGVGRYQEKEGQFYCSWCKSGTFVNVSGASNCNECPSGKYQEAYGETDCLHCSSEDNPCGSPFQIKLTKVTVSPNSKKTMCLAEYRCNEGIQGSLLEDAIYVPCKKGKEGYFWIEPNFRCDDLQFTDPRRGGRFDDYMFYDTTYDGGRWTIIQQRFSKRGSLFFDKTYAEYEAGFGPTQDQDYWIGNKNIADLSKDVRELAIFLWDEENMQKTARYSSFSVDPDDYTLFITGYNSNVSNYGDCLRYSNGSIFYAKDRDTVSSCSSSQLSGWWYREWKWKTYYCSSCGNINNLAGSPAYNKSRMMIR